MGKKRVICLSWDPTLAQTRELLLRQAGCEVVSAVGGAGAVAVSCEQADLLVLGHSVPRDYKRAFIQSFRKHCSAPVLSLLAEHQEKLPEATAGVRATDPSGFMQAVAELLER